MSYTLAVQANKVTKYFGPVRALKDVDLQIPTGITYGVIGPNGSGKTTLIRLLAGLSRPTSGEITVLGLPGTGHALHGEISSGRSTVGKYRGEGSQGPT